MFVILQEQLTNVLSKAGFKNASDMAEEYSTRIANAANKNIELKKVVEEVNKLIEQQKGTF